MKIPFSPPDISELEINEVIEALKSGWITTGPRTKLFEKRIAEYCGVEKAVCLNSATAGLELVLKVLGVGAGDEVITSAYTYTASASVIEHVGAKIVLCDTAPDSFEMDYDKLPSLITEKTKVIIPVDIAGKICDYKRLFEIVNAEKSKFKPNNKMQEIYGRIVVLGDCAHSFGAVQNGIKAGKIADFSSFSFHAVKNLTTAEGGAVTWKSVEGIDNDWLYHEFMLWSLHGQSKDALSKTQIGSWEYDIKYLGQKCNMTDIVASIGLKQLDRYDSLLARRREIIALYNKILADNNINVLEHCGDSFCSSGHLYLSRVEGASEEKRNEIIKKLAEKEIATNVHYKPLPMHSAYKQLSFDIANFPNAYNMYKNEITLPLHTLLTDEMVEYVANSYVEIVKNFK